MDVEKLDGEIEELPAPIVILSTQGHILRINRQARAIFCPGDTSERDLLGQDLVGFVSPEDRDETRLRLLGDGMIDASPTYDRWSITRGDGTTATLGCIIRSISGADGRVLLQAAFIPADEPSVEGLRHLLALADFVASNRIATWNTQEQVNIHSHQLNSLVRGLERVVMAINEVVDDFRNFTDRDPDESS